MKSEGAELLFKLRGDRTPEDVRAGVEAMQREVGRAAASFARSSYAGIAEAIGPLAFNLADMRAQAVGAMGDSLSLARAALAHSLGTFVIAAETIRARGEEVRVAVEAAGRLGSVGAFADGYG
jgi:hypothetical protein